PWPVFLRTFAFIPGYPTHNLLFLLFTATLAFALGFVPTARAADSGSCKYACPVKDGSQFAALSYVTQTGSGAGTFEGDNMVCSYPADNNTSSPTASAFYCTYSQTTGTLSVDHNLGLCAKKADSSATSKSACPVAAGSVQSSSTGALTPPAAGSTGSATGSAAAAQPVTLLRTTSFFFVLSTLLLVLPVLTIG
ncbi:hypothetical protein BKA62DRAFT_703580, partial [Auriculariales sp. MPI-PUGE-AT-0066]